MRRPYILGAAVVGAAGCVVGQLAAVSASSLQSASGLQHLEVVGARGSSQGFLADPALVFVLLLVAFAGIGAELLHPGAIFPGVTGAVAGVVGVIGLLSLSVNPLGLALIVLALTLLTLDIFLPAHGVLSIAGIGLLVAGGFVLFNDREGSGFLLVVVAAPIAGGAGWLAVSRRALQVRRLPFARSAHELLGARGVVRSASGSRGTALVEGELWRIVSHHDQLPPVGAPVQVLAEDGLTLIVEPEVAGLAITDEGAVVASAQATGQARE